jgi:peptidoglycan hydrolase-like protein with peptidoglycan-binding domain
LRRILPHRATDAIAAVLAAIAVLAVLVNALVLQYAPRTATIAETRSGNQTAKLSKQSIIATPPPTKFIPISTPVPPPRPENAVARNRNEIVLEIQRELAIRGYYDGTIDGLRGPRTEQAIREFEQAHGLKLTGDANETLLGQIRRARVKSEVTGSIDRSTTSADSARVFVVQRALARLGYGPLRLNGNYDSATRAAIERFERDRKLPPSGEISDRLTREIAAVTGAPLN